MVLCHWLLAGVVLLLLSAVQDVAAQEGLAPPSNFTTRYRRFWEEDCGGQCIGVVGVMTPFYDYAGRQHLRRTVYQQLWIPYGMVVQFVFARPHIPYNKTHLDW